VKRKLIVAGVVLSLVSPGLAGCKSRARDCVEQGGTVVQEREYDMKKKKKFETEYECIVNGKEVDEWKV
jgi:hypothetical protein